MSNNRRSWTRGEILIAMHLYFQMPFGQFHARNPLIAKVARQLERTPSSLAMKLCNLASFDLAHQQRGISGLSGSSQMDREVWAEFQRDWTKMAEESASEMARLMREDTAAMRDDYIPIPQGETSVQAQVLVRKGQGFFRSAVLAAYGFRCCLTGCEVRSLLVASHIVPWSMDEANRLNPKNGLCLAPLQDKVFDQGLISLDDDYRVIISKKLLSYKSDPLIGPHLPTLENVKVRLPERLCPSLDLIRIHRSEIFSPNN